MTESPAAPGPATHTSPAPTSAVPSGSGPAYPPPTPARELTPAPSFGLPPTQPAPPSYDPTLLMQAVPVSGAYESEPGEATSGGRTAIVVLSVLLGLFVLTSVTLGGLYVRQGQETTQRSEQLAALQAENETMQRQLNAAQRDLRDADDDLATTRTGRDAIADCLTAIYDWWDALDEAGGVDTPETQAVWLEASRLCRVAEPYL